MRLEDLELDVEQIDDGVWMDVPGDEDGMALKLRGRRSKAYKAGYARDLRKVTRANGRNKGNQLQQFQRADAENLAEHCILDWRNFFAGNSENKGEPIPYSPETAKQLMTSRKTEPFQELVSELVSQIDSGYDDSEEEIVGN